MFLNFMYMKQSMSFYIWLLFLNRMFWRFIHVYVYQSFIFKYLNSIMSLFIFFLNELLAIINTTDMKISCA